MLMAFISWWYGKGLAWRAMAILDGLERSMDTFSLGLLVKTWFAPFRQIDAGDVVGGSLEMRFRKSLDKLFSRCIGAFLRTIVMMVGVFYITAKAIWGIFGLILWLVMPILPVVFLGVFITGWTPDVISGLRAIVSKGGSNVNIFGGGR